ncbi:PREDICTED: uncharacterized protein LOC109462145 [Branchiostoma belcheri]|uniref:Uncharacterized protein LOC109462145 n=1 Tax=Branchiostoma belcheri TaxID=7741 RepID=A0A6P4XQ41_BRABE|nr:PREDICTED: uncharacterized protein LOC109462145 [Branchiostoma belcheri]
MAGTPMSEDISSTTADTSRDENNEIYQPEDNPHWSTSLLETKEVSTLYTAETDSTTISTSPGNISSIDEERSAAEATDIADDTEPVYHNPEDNTDSNPGPPIDGSDLDDTDRAPSSNIQHPDTTGSLDDTINSGTGDVDMSDDIDIKAYDVPYETSNEPDTQNPNKRVMTNPMYEELPDDKNLQKLQSQPSMKALQQNTIYGGLYLACIPLSQLARGDSPIYRYCYLIAFAIFLVMVGLITAGIMVELNHNTQDHGLGTQQTDTGTVITFGGYGKIWKKGLLVWKKQRKPLNGKFYYVSGLAVSSTNEIFASDPWNRRIQVFSMKGDFLHSITTGKRKPYFIAMDRNDTLWVILTSERMTKNNFVKPEDNKNRIYRYSREGHFLEKFPCTSPLNLKYPDKFALDTLSDDIIMISKANRRVKRRKVKTGSACRFNKDSCTIQPFGGKELKKPSNVAVDKEGNIYITEEKNHKVLKYDKNGKYISCFGRKGKGASNHLKSPVGICVDSLGRIIVADWGNNRVEMFTAEGEYIRSIANVRQPLRVAIGREGQLIVSCRDHYITIFPKSSLLSYSPHIRYC